jgi:cysteinyl-tRNA synthetase
VVRYFLGSAHYRSTLDLHDTALAEAAAAFERIEAFLARGFRADAHLAPAVHVPDDFAAAMDDDLGVPGALAVVFDTIRAGNTAFDAADIESKCSKHGHRQRPACGVPTYCSGSQPPPSQYGHATGLTNLMQS